MGVCSSALDAVQEKIRANGGGDMLDKVDDRAHDDAQWCIYIHDDDDEDDEDDDGGSRSGGDGGGGGGDGGGDGDGGGGGDSGGDERIDELMNQ